MFIIVFNNVYLVSITYIRQLKSKPTNSGKFTHISYSPPCYVIYDEKWNQVKMKIHVILIDGENEMCINEYNMKTKF
jgi:hypothetical protein